MDKISEALKAAARKLFLSSTYEKLTVGELCRSSNTSRAAFYARFDNKDELFKQILLDDVCQPIRTIRATIETKKFENVSHRIIDETQNQNILDNRDFYSKLVAEMPQFFETVLIEGLTEINKEVLAGWTGDPMELDYLTHFFAANHVMLFKHWITEGFTVDSSTLASWYSKWSTTCWVLAVS